MQNQSIKRTNKSPPFTESLQILLPPSLTHVQLAPSSSCRLWEAGSQTPARPAQLRTSGWHCHAPPAWTAGWPPCGWTRCEPARPCCCASWQTSAWWSGPCRSWWSRNLLGHRECPWCCSRAAGSSASPGPPSRCPVSERERKRGRERDEKEWKVDGEGERRWEGRKWMHNQIERNLWNEVTVLTIRRNKFQFSTKRQT